MEETKIRIRTAGPDDAEQLLTIYAPYVEKTAITFEYEVPDVEEFGRWYNMIWMEKMIGDHEEHPKPFVPFPDILKSGTEAAD